MLSIALILVALVLSAAVAMTIGDHKIEVLKVYSILWDHICGRTYVPGSDEFWDDFIIWEERMPRVVGAILAGMGLAVSGAAMQALMKNPLADPYTTGISSGAMMGVTVGLVLGVAVSIFAEDLSLVFFAFLCGLIPSLVIVGMSKFRNTSPATLILAGLAMSFMFGAVTQLLLLGAQAETVQETYKWMNGTLGNINIDQLPMMGIIVIVGSVFFLVVTKQLNLIGTGDNSAKSLGLDADRFRSLCLIVISFIVAMVVSVVGIMGFVGLVVPHICRYLVGNDNRFVLPASMIFGGFLIVFSDIVTRTIDGPNMPVGIILSFTGGPMFPFPTIRQ
ncbi:MAG: iron ABC transporter permease, partial [archaeon]|nr:iron ABC transporter permease [archaeon]